MHVNDEEWANFIRQRSVGLAGAELHEAVSHVTSLQSIADTMFRASHMRLKKVYDMKYLVNCLMLAGYLRNSGELLIAVRYACALAIPDDRFRKYIDSELMKPQAVPSATTLYRHRLTAGCC